MYSNAYVWSRVLSYLEQHSPAIAIASYFDDAEVTELTESKLVIYSPSPFRKDVIVKRYIDQIREAMRDQFQTEVEVVVLDETELPQYSKNKKTRNFVESNSQYTFDKFAVGSSNQHAFSAARAVADNPADAYNPLFIYGESGLGKTHLLYAIANQIQREHPDYNIVYIKGDQFTNELIDAVRSGKNFEFRDKYRNADLFLMDDIQFIAGKDATQEEFFHTFNSLYENKRQIVLTSDRVPGDMVRLEDRLRTRFEWGLIVDVQPQASVSTTVSGHDLHDLKLLLEQTAGRGIAVYTHGEMLPAHAYPELKKYPHLKGNFGTAWQNQQKEFADLPAPILFTTNCLMPPRPSYADRVFTTAVVGYPDIPHIGAEKDFTPVIERALELGGYAETQHRTGMNGGTGTTTGFAHDAVLANAAQIVEAVRSGAIRHFFLVGGCDGARAGRNYYTEFVRQTPPDTVVLTLACGKYRFHDMDLGTVAGLPRLLDIGQCNDAYSAIQIALALAEAFQCGVNDLPLSMVLSWYEQKAVCILLTLLHLGIRNIRLGPTLPAFLSPNVLQYLVEHYAIAPITTPEADLAALLG